MRTASDVRFDSLEKKLDKLTEVAQATHDQAIKTNGRVNGLEGWKGEHSAEANKWKDNISADIKSLNNTIKIWSGGIIVLSAIGSSALYLYASSLKAEITEMVLKKIADEYQIVELAKPK
jgi:glucose-6-phosphate isomerase